jgi:hypothetical protein
MEKLFQYSLFAIFEQRKTLAVREVENLERSILRGPTLEGLLQEIAAKHELDVAHFQGEVVAKRRIEERDVSDGFGGHHHVKEPWLDVSVHSLATLTVSGLLRLIVAFRIAVCVSVRTNW